MSDTIFDEFGYVICENLAGLTQEDVESVIADEIKVASEKIKGKEDELNQLKLYLSALEYESRTIRLLYKENNK